jgi:hypothetical protein
VLGLGVAFVLGEVPEFAEPNSGMHDGGSGHGAGMKMIR